MVVAIVNPPVTVVVLSSRRIGTSLVVGPKARDRTYLFGEAHTMPPVLKNEAPTGGWRHKVSHTRYMVFLHRVVPPSPA